MSTKTTQADKAYNFLKAKITNWSLKPGDPLVEPVLAREIEVSRTPVREALRRLEHEGLVKTIAGKGAFVSEISMQDIIELYQMREILETGALRLASLSPDRGAIAPLVERLNSAHELINQTENSRYYELIRELDRAILTLTRNQRLMRALEEIWTQIQRLRNFAARNPTRLRSTVAEHREIYTAVLDGDSERAAELFRQHNELSLQNVIAQ